MVDPAGKPYEIAVEGALGGRPFENSAINALEKSTFDPATLNGRPVHSAASFKYRFAVKDLAKAASKDFVSRYRMFIGMVQSGDRAAATASLSKLKATNLYEDAYRNVALYQYSRAWGAESEQIEHLENAIAGETGDGYLEKEVLIQVLGAMLTLDLKRQYIADSWSGWQMLKRLAPVRDLEPWKPIMAEVQRVMEAGGTLKFSGEIPSAVATKVLVGSAERQGGRDQASL